MCKNTDEFAARCSMDFLGLFFAQMSSSEENKEAEDGGGM
jgi:hypothetical protein